MSCSVLWEQATTLAAPRAPKPSFVGSSFTQLTASSYVHLSPNPGCVFPMAFAHFCCYKAVLFPSVPTLAISRHEEPTRWTASPVLITAFCSAPGKPAISQLPGSLRCSCLLFCLTPCSQGEGGTEPTAPSKVPTGVGAVVTHQQILGLHQSRPWGTAGGCYLGLTASLQAEINPAQAFEKGNG